MNPVKLSSRSYLNHNSLLREVKTAGFGDLVKFVFAEIIIFIVDRFPFFILMALIAFLVSHGNAPE